MIGINSNMGYLKNQNAPKFVMETKNHPISSRQNHYKDKTTNSNSNSNRALHITNQEQNHNTSITQKRKKGYRIKQLDQELNLLYAFIKGI